MGIVRMDLQSTSECDTRNPRRRRLTSQDEFVINMFASVRLSPPTKNIMSCVIWGFWVVSDDDPAMDRLPLTGRDLFVISLHRTDIRGANRLRSSKSTSSVILVRHDEGRELQDVLVL